MHLPESVEYPQVNMPPLSPLTRVGIDDVNQNIANIDNSDPFAQVKQTLDGQASARQLRGQGEPDVCDTTLPGNSIVDQTHPALVVALSPTGHNQGLEQSSNPVVSLIQTTYQNILQANPARRRLLVQNTGTSNLYLIFGKASNFTAPFTTQFSIYHVKIAAGDTYIDELWRGRVDIVSDASNGVAAYSEYWRSSIPPAQ